MEYIYSYLVLSDVILCKHNLHNPTSGHLMKDLIGLDDDGDE